MTHKNLLISTEKKLIREIQAFADEYQNNNQVSFYKIWSHLTEAGFHRLLVNTSFGGSGIGLKDYVNIIRLLASADGSVALATHVHNLAVKIVSESIDVHLQKQVTKWLDEGNIFALARSEFERDYRYDFATRIFQDGSTFILSGQKDFCTLAGLADHYVVFAQTGIGNPSMDTLQICMVNGNDPKVEVIKENGLDSMVMSYGVSGPFAKLAFRDGLSVGELLSSMFFVAMVIFWIIVPFTTRKFQGLSWAALWKVIFLGVIGLGATLTFYYIAISELTVSIAIVLLFQFSWMVFLIDWIRKLRRPKAYEIISLLLVLIGTISAVQHICLLFDFRRADYSLYMVWNYVNPGRYLLSRIDWRSCHRNPWNKLQKLKHILFKREGERFL